MMEHEKISLRRSLRSGGAGITPEESRRMREHLLLLGCLKEAGTVLTYHPLEGEADLLPLLEAFPRKNWIFPRVEGEHLVLHRWEPGSAWIAGAFGVQEPDASSWAPVSPGDVDLALVPGLAFDRLGWRLGRGKGFYDRLLGSEGFRALRIGAGVLVERVPSEAHDIPMDLVVTPEGILGAGNGGADWTNPPKADNPMGR